MKIVVLSEEEFDSYSKKHIYNSYYQSSEYAKFEHDIHGYDIQYFGFVDEHEKMVGASLFLYKKILGNYKFAYAPRGMLIDYDDKKVVHEVTKKLKEVLRKQKFIFVKLDPPYVINQKDFEGKVIKSNENYNNLLNNLNKLGYKHLGFNIYNESNLPRWNVLSKLNSDEKITFNKYSEDVKKKIIYAKNMALFVKEDNELNIDKFYECIEPSYHKKGKRFFEKMASSLKSKMHIYYSFLDTREYTKNANDLYNKETEINNSLSNIIQTGDIIKYNMSKVISDKLESDKKLTLYKKDVLASTKFLSKYPNGMVCGAALVIEEAKGVNILINYKDERYKTYNSIELLTYEIMKQFGKKGFNYISLGSIAGNFNTETKYYETLKNKMGFNSSVIEYIGEFDLVISPLMYKIYLRKNKK